MNTITIGFSTRKDFNLLSILIKLIERSNFSHAYVKLDLQNINRTLIYQASGLEVNFQNIDSFNSKETIVKEFKLSIPEDKHAELMQFMIDNVGVPYGIMQLLGILFIKLFNLKKNPFASKNNTEICCKLAAKVVEVVGIKIDKDLDTLDLNDLYSILEEQCGK